MLFFEQRYFLASGRLMKEPLSLGPIFSEAYEFPAAKYKNMQDMRSVTNYLPFRIHRVVLLFYRVELQIGHESDPPNSILKLALIKRSKTVFS